MRRYLSGLTGKEKEIVTDVVIIGSGIAGAYAALCISDNINVVILAKEEVDVSNSALAQGGIAVSLSKEDSPKDHYEDTLYAGADLCNKDNVWILVNEAKDNIKNLCDIGVNFDMKEGSLDLTREAAHSHRRIIHSGDATGKEVCDKLLASAKTKKNIRIIDNAFAIDLITNKNKSIGLLINDQKSGKNICIKSKYVICASGGFGQLYENTSNPIIATGDGMALGYRAGANLMDMEFVQFHPTVLHHKKNSSFLISESVRGEGAILKNCFGKRFMHNYHELGDLAPRDVVARSIFTEMGKTNNDCVYIDITHEDREYLEKRFPKIFSTCLKYGIDMSKDFIPVAPAEHYCMGGIKTDTTGKTGIENFYACGEVSCTGIHGANRLASNSLLEGLVFSKRIANDISINHNSEKVDTEAIKINENKGTYSSPTIEIEKSIKHIMNTKVGIVRDKEGLEDALKQIDILIKKLENYNYDSIAQYQTVNMATIAKIVIMSALKREESRGAHYRSDFNKPREEWKKNINNIRRRIDDETFEFND